MTWRRPGSTCANAIAAGFEALDRKLDEGERRLSDRIDGVERRLSERIDGVERRMDRIEARLDRVEDRLRIHGWLLAPILAAVIAPYVERLFAGAW